MRRLLFAALAALTLAGTVQAESFWNIGPNNRFTYGQFNPNTGRGWSTSGGTEYNYFRAPRYPVYAPYSNQGLIPRGGYFNSRPNVYGQPYNYGWGW